MHVAFVHRRGFGQFAALAAHLAQAGNEVSLITETIDQKIPSVRVVRHRAESGPRANPDMARHMGTPDHHARIGHRVAETLDAMGRQGLVPDIVVGHIGWGSMMFLKDVLPQVPALGYCEFFYRSEGADIGFAPDDRADLETRKRLRLRNIAQLLSLEAIEAGISPPHWQRSLYPADAQGRIRYVTRASIRRGFDQIRQLRSGFRTGACSGLVVLPLSPLSRATLSLIADFHRLWRLPRRLCDSAPMRCSFSSAEMAPAMVCRHQVAGRGGTISWNRWTYRGKISSFPAWCRIQFCGSFSRSRPHTST